ncbi:hypothetical protein AQJ58_20220 [Streptomyces sp. DSM 15324]|nr:hypothetical protein AQJ58_20220 [Streptomyces sp. DSM 15324]
MWEQGIGTFPVDFTEHGNEWAHHLGNAMGGGFRSISGTDSHGGPVEMGPPLDDSVTSILRVTLTPTASAARSSATSAPRHRTS